MIHQLQQLGGLLNGSLGPFLSRRRERFAMLGVGVGVRLVPIGLARLCQQNERSGVGSLQTEREVKENEWINVKMRDADDVQNNPNCDDDGLRNQEDRRAEEAGERLRLERKPVVAENCIQNPMRKMKTKMVAATGTWRKTPELYS